MQINEFQFYQLLQNIIVDKKEKLNSGNLIDFFEPNEFFELALSLSYMILTRDAIVSKSNPDSVNFRNLGYLFTDSFCSAPPRIYDAYSLSPLWVISSIRDSLLHNACSVNLQTKEIMINNPNPEGNLHCDIPFEWFNKYGKYHIFESKLVNELDVKGIFLTSDTHLMQKKFNSVQDIEKFINNVIAYKIHIKSPDLLDENIIRRYIENFIDVKSSDIISKNNLEYLSYEGKWAFIVQRLKKDFKRVFPDIEVTIEQINSENVLDDFNKLYNNEDIFSHTKYKDQYSLLVNRLMRYYRMPKTAVTDSVESLIATMQIYNQELKSNEDYEECKEVIEYILNLNNDGGKTLEFIHEYRKNKNLTNTYYNNFVGDSHSLRLDDEDRERLKQYLTKQFGFEPSSIQVTLGTIKAFDEDLYNKYKNRYEESNAISDEDIAFYNMPVIKMAQQLRQKTTEVQKFLELGLVTTLGITTYAMNKEAIFDAEGYENIDKLEEIPSYSSGLYKSYSLARKELEEKIHKLEAKLKRIDNDPNFKSSKKKERLKRKIERDLEISKERFEAEEAPEEEIITYNNKKYKLTNNNDTARIIRNCLAHLDRIKYASYDEGMLLLEDEKGIIKCNIEDLYNFILNDTFMQRVQKHYIPSANGPKL